MNEIKDVEIFKSMVDDVRFFKKITCYSGYYKFYKLINSDYYIALTGQHKIFYFFKRNRLRYGELLDCDLEEIFENADKELRQKLLFNMDQLSHYKNAKSVFLIPDKDIEKFLN